MADNNGIPAGGLSGWLTKNIANMSMVTMVAVLFFWMVMYEFPRIHEMYGTQIEKGRDNFAHQLDKEREQQERWQGRFIGAMEDSTRATTSLINELKTTRHEAILARQEIQKETKMYKASKGKRNEP